MRISKYLGWRVRLGILLVLISIILYSVNYAIFHDSRDLFFYLAIDIAFLPIEVLFVVLVIESAISERDKTILLEKLNMVIGTFFSEVGTHLVKNISEFDSKVGNIRKNLIVSDDWSRADFLDASRQIRNYNYRLSIIDSEKSIEFLECLKHFLIDKRNFLLVLLENPSLLEHETFTDLLRAVFHLTEELEQRNNLKVLPRADYEHLELDIERAYKLLIYEWLQYMEYLMNEYPYLFSLAIRTNPFDPNAKVEIED
ncbi:MAG: hypothetical protein ACLPWD_04775 [Methanobacterium sp.]